MPRALIIDDESGIRFALRRWFERQGWFVLEASDGDVGLQHMLAATDDSDERLDVIICDMNLPKRSGESLYAEIERERPALTTRIIFSTGDDVGSARPGSLLQTHPWVLQKPFDMGTLKGIVAAVAG
ncbi:MAG TPA: response regulator [Gemmatimonas sp.]|nr:response regulator [Gemmatimonas sp.]